MVSMPIPNFQSFFVPILRVASDGKTHTPREFEEGSAAALKLTSEDRSQMLTSGTMTVVMDRTGWAYYHLYRAGLLERPKRGTYSITERGRKILAEFPDRIDQKILRGFPEYMDYLAPRPGRNAVAAEAVDASVGSETPQQAMEEAFLLLRKRLAQDVLDSVLGQTPAFFERLVVNLLVKMGYGGSREDAGEAIGQSGDEGIDGVIKEDRLGLDIIYIQAKKWATTSKIDRQGVQAFVGSLAGKQAQKGVFITTSSFQDSARQYVKHLTQKVILIDGVQLAELCIEFGIGVTESASYVLKKIDPDFFAEG